MNPNRLHAWQAAEHIARRELRAEDLVRACLERIDEREPALHAFVQLDREAALAQARALDAGPLRGWLHGLPLGVKDVFDTVDLPTGYGTPIHAGHRPAADAAAVSLCREAGSLVLGKTVSTELANMHPGPTCNPHRLTHTPGGSSSGSAAAVADFMLPLALGTQTAGSLIRPAAFCGIVGYKPSLGRVPRAGVKSLSESLDTVGGFGRCVRDVALLGAVLTGDARLRHWQAPDAPRIGLCRTPQWDQADADTQRTWQHAADVLAPLAAACRDTALPAGSLAWVQLQKDVMAHETARSLSHERTRHAARLSTPLRALLDAGSAIDGAMHAADVAAVMRARQAVDALFERHDLLLAPSTLGEAPAGLDHTGDPLFCRGWTMLGLPCIHLPVGHGASGLPVGVQLIGRYGDDHRLLGAAQWAFERLGG